ncbi:tyrosine-protein phosphatase [Phytopseudomonas dryadis]|uniref:protein-tyrosine-phosphatase n=1 Tax=Phytopseudomonas dryadis TaxID=2487520 RepID=A0A4Q9QU13_9GAMM|nr:MULTISPECIES: CpsB/CapC family capsule biosynthesis tyrosine phosphatase [Pseudomonas]TBU86717.1 capsular biosynthesis protein [Pseudomonas dryadis]TBV05422.1 capsular biosynthesis protein [Pseudomonas dryadis]TBV18431.1 capsular biosynthesis protein [Pseudomonas sp. FRB 230]
MIDLHNHLLPGIDDGPADLSTALDMARMAVANGITHIVCTPHIHSGRYENDSASIRNACENFAVELDKAGIDLRIGAAAEVRFASEIMARVLDGSIPFLGQWEGKRALLLEFPHGELPFGAERLTEWLLAHAVVPILAHPERNKALMQTPSKLKPFIEQGCLLQVTASSVAGRFGERAMRLARELLEQGVVSIIASDAHNLDHRPPELQEGLLHAARILGEREAERLVIDTPWRIAHRHFV